MTLRDSSEFSQIFLHKITVLEFADSFRYVGQNIGVVAQSDTYPDVDLKLKDLALKWYSKKNVTGMEYINSYHDREDGLVSITNYEMSPIYNKKLLVSLIAGSIFVLSPKWSPIEPHSLVVPLAYSNQLN